MTDEEKKAQEAAAAAAAEAENAGGEAGGEAGNQGEGGEGGEQKPEEKSPRDIFYERIRTSAPDGKFDEDEQEYYRKAIEMFEALEDSDSKYKGLTDKMMRRYKDDPEEVAILLDYMEGMPLMAAIRKYKGDEAFTMKEGDEGWEEYQAAGEKRKADREKYEQLMGEIKSNTESTVNAFDKWAEGHNLDEAQREEIWKTMNTDLDKMSRGIFDDEIFNRYFKAANYEGDVEGAKAQGEADGKNAAIEAKKEQMKGSGLPGLNNNTGKKEERELTDREKKAQSLSFLKG